MNKQQAFQEMVSGLQVTNRFFTSDEYLWYNPDTGQITTEEGYHMFNYWDSDYLPGVEWLTKEDN